MKKKPGKAASKQVKTTLHKKKTSDADLPAVKKVTVGEDEFCPTCMEWRCFDEITGKCTVCGRLIRKNTAKAHTIAEEFDLKDFTNENDEPSETGEF